MVIWKNSDGSDVNQPEHGVLFLKSNFAEFEDTLRARLSSLQPVFALHKAQEYSRGRGKVTWEVKPIKVQRPQDVSAVYQTLETDPWCDAVFVVT